MMNRIMIPGVAAVALAASALLAPTAAADAPGKRGGSEVQVAVGKVLGADVRIEVASDRNRGRGRGYNDRPSYNPREDRREARAAVRQCHQAVERTGYRLGYRDVDVDDTRVRQIGPDGYLVRLETEFEGRRRDFERDVRCEVRRGRIVSLEGIPQPGRRGGKAYNYHGRGW